MTLLCDPSHIGGKREYVEPLHIGGKREYVEPLSQLAMDAGFDGLMIESHCNPAQALSDSAQQITPNELKSILDRLVIRSGAPIEDELALLRQQIDDCDHELLAVLARRMSISREIGRFKARVDEGSRLGLDADFTQRIMQAIHEDSVRQQLDIMNDN